MRLWELTTTPCVFFPALSNFKNTIYVVLNYIFKLNVCVSVCVCSWDNAACHIINMIIHTINGSTYSSFNRSLPILKSMVVYM